jgi:hypothetical protein
MDRAGKIETRSTRRARRKHSAGFSFGRYRAQTSAAKNRRMKNTIVLAFCFVFFVVRASLCALPARQRKR